MVNLYDVDRQSDNRSGPLDLPLRSAGHSYRTSSSSSLPCSFNPFPILPDRWYSQPRPHRSPRSIRTINFAVQYGLSRGSLLRLLGTGLGLRPDQHCDRPANQRAEEVILRVQAMEATSPTGRFRRSKPAWQDFPRRGGSSTARAR